MYNTHSRTNVCTTLAHSLGNAYPSFTEHQRMRLSVVQDIRYRPVHLTHKALEKRLNA